MYYILLDKDNHIEHVLNTDDDPSVYWYITPQEGRHVILREEVNEIDQDNNLYDYVYNDETEKFDYIPSEQTIEYTDLETGEQVTMTSKELDALVDEKVRNNVEAIMQQMIEDGTFSIPVASSSVDVINEFGDQNDS